MQRVGRGEGVGVALDLGAALRQRARPPDEGGPGRRGRVAAGVRRRPVVADHMALVLAPAKERGNYFLSSAVVANPKHPVLSVHAASHQSRLGLPEPHFLADIEVEEVGRELDVGAVIFDLFVGADGVVRWHGYAPDGSYK